MMMSTHRGSFPVWEQRKGYVALQWSSRNFWVSEWEDGLYFCTCGSMTRLSHAPRKFRGRFT